MDVRQIVYEDVITYGPQILLIILLSVITIFRREMSCNSVYGGEDDDDERKMMDHYKRLKKPRSNSNDSTTSSSSGMSVSSITSTSMKCQSMDDTSKKCPLLDLPLDIQIHFVSYLHTRDVLTFGCVDHQTHIMIHGGEEKEEGSGSILLWYHLFMRDYAVILRQWKYGIDAVNRSRHSDQPWTCPAPIASLLNYNHNHNHNHNHNLDNHQLSEHPKSLATPTMKEFYLKFSQTWLSYSIAGRTQNPTLTGIHGHVFDMTSFLEEHPGSPETIIVSGGGKDATSFFESVGHSKKARGLALDRLVEVVDQTCCIDGDDDGLRSICGSSFGGDFSEMMGEGWNGKGSCGVICVTAANANTNNNATKRNNLKQLGNILPRRRSKPRTPGTLWAIRNQVQREEQEALHALGRQVMGEMAMRGESGIIGNVNVYFDPLCYVWKGWYMNLDFETVFVSHGDDSS